jgi:hypothetical protein
VREVAVRRVSRACLRVHTRDASGMAVPIWAHDLRRLSSSFVTVAVLGRCRGVRWRHWAPGPEKGVKEKRGCSAWPAWPGVAMSWLASLPSLGFLWWCEAERGQGDM